MRDPDRDAWRCITIGERPPRWQDLFGDPVGADYLTAEGKAVAQRGADYLEQYFGPSWLSRAMRARNDATVPIPHLARSSPVFALSPGRRAGAYLELVGWWASLALLETLPGQARMRRDARQNVQPDRFLHTLAQARLAITGSSADATVTLEPETPNGTGDVLLRWDQNSLLIEVVTVSPDAGATLQDSATDRRQAYLLGLESQHGVHWEGELPGHLPAHDLDTWQDLAARAASDAQQQQTAVTVTHPTFGELTARPGPAPSGASLAGPVLHLDAGRRLLDKLERKAHQTRGPGAAWIWVEDHGLFHPTTPFQSSSLQSKVASLTGLITELLDCEQHLAGVVLSSAKRILIPDSGGRDETVNALHGHGIRRHLPDGRVRETIVLPRRMAAPEPARLLGRMCMDEPRWLDWALPRLGVVGGYRSLLA